MWELTDRNEDWQRSDLPMAYSHEGSTNRTASQVLFSPDLGFGLVVLSNTAIGLDQARWNVFIDGLVHTALGTQAAQPPPADPLFAVAPFLLVGLPLLQGAALIWVGQSTRRTGRTKATIAVALALIVHAAALFFVFWVAPTQDPTVPSLEFLWESFPDVGISSILSIVLAVLLAGHLTIRLTKTRARTPARHRDP